MKVDLHMHSYCSDGSLDCQSLVDEIKEKNIELFSLTDHDTIAGLEEMLEIVKDEKILFVPGVELATTYLGKEYHLTTYGYDKNNADLLELLALNLKIRSEFDIEIIKYLEKDATIDIKLSEFLTYEDDPYKGGWPSINYLMEKGLIDTLGDFFKLLSGFNIEMTFPKPEEVIKTAHAAGAHVFLAHPSSNQKGGLDRKILDFFLKAGIDGLECYSPYCQTEEETKRYVNYCHEHQLYISGGSDYHGKFVGRHLGEPHVTSDMVSIELFKSISIK